MAKNEIKRLLENSKKTLDNEYENSAKIIKDQLNSAKKKTLDQI
jgi:protein-arginine kinase activator protein McsA